MRPVSPTSLHSLSARVAAVVISVSMLVATQVYYAYNLANTVYGLSILVLGVVMPLAAACVLLMVTDQRAVLLAYIGLFWSIVDDAPIFFDSVLTWPQVTRFHPYLPHLALEVALHLATLGFLVAAAVVAGSSGRRALYRRPLPIFFAFVSSIFAYSQNLPFPEVQDFITAPQSWYELDILEHIAALAFISLALYIAHLGTDKQR